MQSQQIISSKLQLEFFFFFLGSLIPVLFELYLSKHLNFSFFFFFDKYLNFSLLYPVDLLVLITLAWDQMYDLKSHRY